ncbi:Peptidase family M23 [Micromonospora pallida]|uniref:Peptidase family M23 n=1 Tax=Micromonospora pallida TaxID=145854 RepID=A0A1C6S996_9ACTN|nr:Peptidase family M23 [Micromonospora pallida]
MRSRTSLKLSAPVAALTLALSMVVAPTPASAAAPYLELPFSCGTSWTGDSGSSNAHRNNEIDFNLSSGADDRGQPVLAAAAGTIRWEGGASSDYGNYVEIDHGDGYSTLYAHLQDKFAHIGDTVVQGEKIGTVGNTDGNSPGISPHLHFEYRNRGSGQSYPDYIRPASFHGDPFDYATGRETYVSQNCGSTTPTSMPGLSAVSRGVGGLDVFAVTTDGRLKHRNYSSGAWSCWSTLYGNATIKGEPAAIASSGRIDVFAQGIDNRLKKITWTSAHGWYQWADMGDYTITSAPAVTSRSATGIDVFVKNSANKIVYRHFDTASSAWTTNWSNIGENAATISATSGPAAVANADGTRMNVFARATDGSLLSLMWTRDHGWYNWADRGGNLNGRPSASTRSGNSVDIFMRDQDNSLIHWYSPDGADWTTYPKSDFGGWLAVSPTAVSWNSGRIDVFSRNSGADLIQKAWTSTNDWYAWAGHGPVGAPAC